VVDRVTATMVIVAVQFSVMVASAVSQTLNFGAKISLPWLWQQLESVGGQFE